jgi:hypothetical protein
MRKMEKYFELQRLTRTFLLNVCLIVLPGCFWTVSAATGETQYKYTALPIARSSESCPRILYRYGVPFIETTWRPPKSGFLQVNVGARAEKIFFLGMTEAERPSAWSDARSYADRFFIGDDLGQVRLNYADGSSQEFPLLLGESVWWGLPFYQTQYPFPTDTHLRLALGHALFLYPARPVSDGNYVAVIKPKEMPLASIEILGSKAKHGSVAIAGITLETALDVSIVGGTVIPGGKLSPGFATFMEQKALRPVGVDESGSQQRLDNLKKALYTTDASFKQPIAVQIPNGYSGTRVTFGGTPYASALENAYYTNLEDMLSKVDPDGMYHTSTRGALAWAGIPWSAGGEFGTYRPDVGIYYGDSWSRDLGRSLQELTDLGYTKTALKTADYALSKERLWSLNSSLKYHGESLPPHWSRVINKPDFSLPFENDGHGLISLFLYQLWRRLPDRDTWLRSHWSDVKAAGDWIPWQFAHPVISGATGGVLHTTGESAGGNGYSVYADAICMTALEGLAQMADSIGERQSAELWRDTAEGMRKAIPARYFIDDPKYGTVWTLADAGWPNKSTVLGPLIFTADYRGYAPEDIDAAWKLADEAAYQRLIDTYKPFGFYGWAMGYGQGFVTQAALLLDRMEDATTMLNWTAREVYDPQIHSYVVPEGAQIDPTGRFIYRTGDQGNGVQEAEIMKIFRILIGVDDMDSQHLRILPRLPYGWSELAVNDYPVLIQSGEKTESTTLRYELDRVGSHMSLNISSASILGPVSVRLGPFKNRPNASDIKINGKLPSKASIDHSGDSWWVQSMVEVDPRSYPTQVNSEHSHGGQ